ncbi:AMP-binding protein [Prosthecobacter sp.]|uniref:AMP-binding protein n=1 Tax=Prosthecobacter sp. TaxID=1965333 RepID=UPI003783C131
METALILKPAFWEDGSVWIAQPAADEEGRSLAQFARDELKVRDWCFFQTSGTEGSRKWVGLTKEALMISARAVNEHFGITAGDHWLLALPVYHVGGFGILARSAASGSKVTQLEGKWDAAAFVQKCAEAGATLASLVPTQIFDLVSAGLQAPGTMRVVLVGGGALNQELEEAALKLGWPVRRTYGMTETASGVAAQRDAGGGMEVLPIWEVRTSAEGVLSVSGPALARGYAIQEGGVWRWEDIPADGMRTRDRVEIWQNAAGKSCLRFVGRESGIVKILGELVALEPIQDRIEALKLQLGLSGADAAVCDVPDGRKESRLVLAVSGTCVSDSAKLQASLNNALRPLEHIHDVRLVPRIPRSELGKVKLSELRGLL